MSSYKYMTEAFDLEKGQGHQTLNWFERRQHTSAPNIEAVCADYVVSKVGHFKHYKHHFCKYISKSN